jgi:hypothetical protein
MPTYITLRYSTQQGSRKENHEEQWMGKNDELLQRLADKIKTRRLGISRFMSELEKRCVRLNNLSIIRAAITTALVVDQRLAEKNSQIIEEN